MRNKALCFREWLRLAEALEPGVKASLEKAPQAKFPDREFLRKAIEDMEREPEPISAPDAWKRLNSLAASSGRGVGKEDAALQKLATIMLPAPAARESIEEYVQAWRAGRMSLPELYSLAFFVARGGRSRRSMLDLLAREMMNLPTNWRKRINFSDRPEISTNDGVSKFDSIDDFSAAIHTLAASELDMSGRLEFDPRTDIRPERRKDLVAQGGGIWIYKGPDPTMCRLYGKGGGKEGNSPWCVAQTSNTQHYFTYRIDREQTFFFIFDTNKSADDKARRVLAGVSTHKGDSEWGDMGNANKINGYGSVEEYKKYLAGKLGMSVQELDRQMSPEPATDAEMRLKQYIDDYANASRAMTKDEIWERLKDDEVYGGSMLDMFLKMTETLERRHWEELDQAQRKLVNPELRLSMASTVEEAERAVRDGARYFDQALFGAALGGHLEVCKWLVEKGAILEHDESDKALRHGAYGGHFEVCKFLVKKGARDFEGALNNAAYGGHLEICKWAAERGERRELARTGAGRFNDALYNAARGGQLDVCKWAVEKGAMTFNNALYIAAEEGHLEICKWLAERGATDFDGALDGAGSPEVREFLLKAKEKYEKG